jgi:hypothetical protein
MNTSTGVMITSDAPVPVKVREMLRVLVGTMIPQSEEYGVPGADDPTIFEDILQTAQPYLDMLTEHMALLEQQQPAFATLSSDRRLAQAQQFLAAQPLFGSLLVSLTTQCYYRDNRVMEALGMEARPPFPKGFEIEQGDWSLLDPVRARGSISRDVP